MHGKARDTIKEFPKAAKKEIGELLLKLQYGISLGIPHAKPMASVKSGVYELRVKDAAGIYRVFYFTKSQDGILVFHAFTKKTQKTPQVDLTLATTRMKEVKRENS